MQNWGALQAKTDQAELSIAHLALFILGQKPNQENPTESNRDILGH